MALDDLATERGVDDAEHSGTYTRAVAGYVAALQYDQLPESAIHAAKRVTLDLLGVVVAARRYPAARIITEYVRDEGAQPRATIVGSDVRSSPSLAALANGVMAAELEQDDVHLTGSHAGSVYVPSVLAVAEAASATGQTWIAGLVCAYDVGIRLNVAMDLARQYSRGFHPTSVSGSFGATAGAAKVLGLDAAAVESALGLNGCQASGLLTWEQEPEHFAKSFQSGVPARNAVVAAELAARGYVGPPSTFDGRYNVFDAFSTRRDFPALISELGERFEIERTMFKFYSCCRAIHTTLDIVFDLRDEHGFTAHDVACIDVSLTPDITPLVDDNLLTTHNLQFVVAAALIDGTVTRVQTSPQRRSDPAVNELASRIALHGDPALAARHPGSGIIEPARVRLRLRTGAEFDVERGATRGSAARPVSDDELEHKFALMAGPIIGDDRVAGIVDVVHRLDRLDTIAELTALLHVG